MAASERITVTEFEKLDKGQFCQLHAIAFRELLKQSMVTENLFTIEHFSWKYNGPAGKARIAVMHEGDKMVGAVSMFPVNLIRGDERLTIWNAGDVAVMPEYRGRFFFNQCMTALKKENEGKDFLFGFPNHNNLSGAKRAGFQPIKDLAFFVKPFFLSLKARSLKKTLMFSSMQDKYGISLAADGSAMIYRSADYMNWRYLQKPGSNYMCYAHQEGNTILGNAVVRVVTIKKIRVLLVMEYHMICSSAKLYLNRFINQAAMSNKCITVLMLSAVDQVKKGRAGFLHIPNRFQPKKMCLYGNPLKEKDQVLLHANWFVQTGDWDAF